MPGLVNGKKGNPDFGDSALLTKLAEDSDEIQVASLVYAMGAEAEHVFKSFTFADADDSKKYDLVMTKFDAHFTSKKNIIHERAVFHRKMLVVSQLRNSSVFSMIKLNPVILLIKMNKLGTKL